MFFWPLGIVGSYLLGSFPTALLVGKRIGHNPSKEGSKNPGATNVYRISGYKAASIVLVGDILKGVIPALLVLLISGEINYALMCSSAAVVGHIFPVFAKFKGGKGVATYGGMILTVNPIIGIITMLTWFASFGITKTSSLSALIALPTSILGALVYHLIYHKSGWEPLALVALGVLITIRHIENIKKLVKGEEGHIE